MKYSNTYILQQWFMILHDLFQVVCTKYLSHKMNNGIIWNYRTWLICITLWKTSLKYEIKHYVLKNHWLILLSPLSTAKKKFITYYYRTMVWDHLTANSLHYLLYNILKMFWICCVEQFCETLIWRERQKFAKIFNK